MQTQSSPFKIILLVLCTIALTACETTTVKTEPIEAPKLGLSRPPPLQLRTVDWKVIETGEELLYTLDKRNFDILVKNDEAIQNRLKLQDSIILKQKKFYEGS